MKEKRDTDEREKDTEPGSEGEGFLSLLQFSSQTKRSGHLRADFKAVRCRVANQRLTLETDASSAPVQCLVDRSARNGAAQDTCPCMKTGRR